MISTARVHSHSQKSLHQKKTLLQIFYVHMINNICMQSWDLNADYQPCVPVNKNSQSEKKRVDVKVNSPLMLHGVLSIQFTLQRPVIFALILHPNQIISLNPHQTDASSLCDLCERVVSLPWSKQSYLHSRHMCSPLTVMALDFMGLFYYKGNKTAGLHRTATW